jgi:hypothetical protein
MWLQEVVQHQWYPRVGIPAPPEMGYGRWSYGEPYCSCVEDREGSHPMYMDAFIYICIGCAQSSY